MIQTIQTLLFIVNLAGGQPAYVAIYPSMEKCRSAVAEAKAEMFLGDQAIRYLCIPGGVR